MTLPLPAESDVIYLLRCRVCGAAEIATHEHAAPLAWFHPPCTVISVTLEHTSVTTYVRHEAIQAAAEAAVNCALTKRGQGD